MIKIGVLARLVKQKPTMIRHSQRPNSRRVCPFCIGHCGNVRLNRFEDRITK